MKNLKSFTQEELDEMIREHEKWTYGRNDGKRLILNHVDISGLDLSHYDLTDSIWANVIATNTNLNDTILNGSMFDKVNFTHAILSETEFLKCSCDNVIFNHTDMEYAAISNSIFNFCTFFYAKMTNVDADYTKFVNCSVNFNIKYSRFHFARFGNTDLSQAINFGKASFFNAVIMNKFPSSEFTDVPRTYVQMNNCIDPRFSITFIPAIKKVLLSAERKVEAGVLGDITVNHYFTLTGLIKALREFYHTDKDAMPERNQEYLDQYKLLVEFLKATYLKKNK